ncbi:LamG domain-containing protein [Planctomycetota bacterium]
MMSERWRRSTVSALVVALCLVSVGQAVDPVAHWTFDEVVVVDAGDPNDPNATIAITPDVSGNGYDGVLTGEYAAVDGVEDGAVDFNGTSVVTVPVEAWNDNIFEGFTVSYWSYTDVASQNSVSVRAVTGTGEKGEKSANVHAPWNNIIMFDTRSDDGNNQRLRIKNTSDQWISQWSHWTYVYTPGRQEIYLNGEPFASGTGTGAIHQDTTYFTIGAEAGGAYGFSGLMDDVRLYNVALTEREIWDLVGPVVLEDFEADLSAWAMTAGGADSAMIRHTNQHADSIVYIDDIVGKPLASPAAPPEPEPEPEIPAT